MSRYIYVEAAKRKATMRKRKKDKAREVKLPDSADCFHRRAN